MEPFIVRGDYITLGQLLKVVGAIGSGGEARDYLETGAVRVSGEPETRRGRKLRAGDVIRLPDGREYLMVAEQESHASQ
jgi:ribosome-associated protein